VFPICPIHRPQAIQTLHHLRLRVHRVPLSMMRCRIHTSKALTLHLSSGLDLSLLFTHSKDKCLRLQCHPPGNTPNLSIAKFRLVYTPSMLYYINVMFLYNIKYTKTSSKQQGPQSVPELTDAVRRRKGHEVSMIKKAGNVAGSTLHVTLTFSDKKTTFFK
jgi:hypothetical protein